MTVGELKDMLDEYEDDLDLFILYDPEDAWIDLTSISEVTDIDGYTSVVLTVEC